MCSSDNCDKPVFSRGMCKNCYSRQWYRKNHPQPTREERFWAKVNKTESCWLWTAGRTNLKKPYGCFRIDGGHIQAHRYSYILAKGEIPEGLEIDHLCFNGACVNPDHLEAVTQLENLRRMRLHKAEKLDIK